MLRRILLYILLGQSGESDTPLGPLYDNLLSFWKLGEASGSRADSIGSATLTDNAGVTSEPGVIGDAAKFVAASNQYLSRSAQTWEFSNEWSVSSWHKQTAAADDKTIYQFGSDMAGPEANSFKLLSNYLYIAPSSGAAFKLYTGIPTSTDWIHTVLTWDGSTLKVYQDGVDITGSLAKPVDNAGTMTDTSRIFQIGAGRNTTLTDPFDGLIDAVGVWSRALEQSDVDELYNSGAGWEPT